MHNKQTPHMLYDILARIVRDHYELFQAGAPDTFPAREDVTGNALRTFVGGAKESLSAFAEACNLGPAWYGGGRRVVCTADHVASAALSDVEATGRIPAAASVINVAVGSVDLPEPIHARGVWDSPLSQDAARALTLPLSHLLVPSSISRALSLTRATCANPEVLYGTDIAATPPSPEEAGVLGSAAAWMHAIDVWCPSCTLWDARPHAAHTAPQVHWTLHSMRRLAHLLHVNPSAEERWCARAMVLSRAASVLAQRPVLPQADEGPKKADAVSRTAWYAFCRVVEACSLMGMSLPKCVPRAVLECAEQAVDAEADAAIGRPAQHSRALALALFGSSETAAYVDTMLSAITSLRVTMETFSPPGTLAPDMKAETDRPATHLPPVASLLTMCDSGAALPVPRLAQGGLVRGVLDPAARGYALAVSTGTEEDGPFRVLDHEADEGVGVAVSLIEVDNV